MLSIRLHKDCLSCPVFVIYKTTQGLFVCPVLSLLSIRLHKDCLSCPVLSLLSIRLHKDCLSCAVFVIYKTTQGLFVLSCLCYLWYSTKFTMTTTYYLRTGCNYWYLCRFIHSIIIYVNIESTNFYHNFILAYTILYRFKCLRIYSYISTWYLSLYLYT